MERRLFVEKSQCLLSNAIPFSTSAIASLTNLSAFTRMASLVGIRLAQFTLRVSQ